MTLITRRTFVLGSIGTFGLAALGCRTLPPAPPPPEGSPAYWPPAEGPWASVEPAAAGWDPAKLGAAVTLAGERSTRSILILLDGRVLAERDFGVEPGFRRDIASCQKSVIGLLVVMARDRGLLDLADPVTDHLGAGWSNATRAEESLVTVRHLLTMTSGLDDGLRRVADPGSRWYYSNNAYYVLRHLLERVTGTGIDPLTHDWLWTPLGIRDSSWYERPVPPDPKGRPVWGLLMPARDMVRFGLLVQRCGTWDGTPVVASAGIDEALAPSQALNPAYGYLWWRNAQPPRRIPGAPDDVVAALGKDDQKIYVSRSTGLVVARLGNQGGGTDPFDPDSFNSALWTALMAAAPL